MVAVVGNGSDQTPSASAGPNGPPGAHAILTPNDLAQLMSGQTVTGMLNPDGTITLNSNLLSGDQNQIVTSNDITSTTTTTTLPKSEQLATSYPISVVPNQGNHSQESPPILQNGISICDSNNISPNTAINSTHCGLSNLITTAGPTTTTATNLSDCNNMDLTNGNIGNTNNNINNNDVMSNNNNDSKPTKKAPSKRLTAKQKQLQQKQQQHQQQQYQQQQPQSISHPTSYHQDSTQFNGQQQHQIVATVQLPNGQIGQLIAPSGGQFWSPNAINLQQLSMAVAAALPIAQQNPISTSNGPQVSFPSHNSNNNTNNSDNLVSSTAPTTSTNHIIKTEHPQSRNLHHIDNKQQHQSTGDMCQQNESGQSMAHAMSINGTASSDQANWPTGAINLNQLSALSHQGVVQLSAASDSISSQHHGGGQRIVEMISPSAIQNFLTSTGQPIQAITLANGTQSFIAQDTHDPNKWNLLQPAPQAYSAQGPILQLAQNQNSTNTLMNQQNQQQQQQQQQQQHQQLANNATSHLNCNSDDNGNNNGNLMTFSNQNTASNNAGAMQFNNAINQGPVNNSDSKSYMVGNQQQHQARSNNGNTTDSSNKSQPHESASASSQQQQPADLEITQSSQLQPMIKLKRLACTCPNCTEGENSRNPGDKKKQHICHFPDCNKVYGKTSHLRAHLRWHSGERPYVCNWSFCGKKFTRSDELQRHRRTHTGEKRFECTECLKRFMRSDHLSKHFKTHITTSKKPIDPL